MTLSVSQKLPSLFRGSRQSILLLALLLLVAHRHCQQRWSCRADELFGDPSSDALQDGACSDLAKDGKCESEPDLMKKYCAKTYLKCLEAKRAKELRAENRDMKRIRDETTSQSFYDLTAETVEGRTVEFEEFEGYVTLVAFVPRACDEGLAAKETLNTLREVRARWPTVVEVVAFPFEHPKAHYYAVGDQHVGEGECSIDHYRAALEEEDGNGAKRVTLKSMREINVRDSDAIDTTAPPHPVYKYFEDVFGFTTISATSATVFLVSPDGDMAEAFYDGSVTKVKNSIKDHIKYEL